MLEQIARVLLWLSLDEILGRVGLPPHRQAHRVMSQHQQLIDAVPDHPLALSRHEEAQAAATARCATWVYFSSM